MSKPSPGYSLIEMMLVISILALVAGFSLPVFQTFQVRNDVDLATTNTAQALRRARQLAQAVDEDSQWGVFVQSESITLFKGSGYASRDTAFDEITDMPATITPGGQTEIIFAKLTGFPNTTGTITFSSTVSGTRDVVINQKGMVEY